MVCAVGIIDVIRAALRPAGASSAPGALPNGTSGPASPWSDPSHLQTIAWADILGGVLEPVTRAEAMGIPAIARARHILCSDAARSPLRVLDAADVEQPAGWLQRSALGVSPQHRAVWTVDDLIHYGWSLWLVQREDADLAAPITEGARCPFDRWSFGVGAEAGMVLVDGKSIPDHVALLIPGFHDGIVKSNPRTIRGARELETSAAQRAAQPIPAMELHQTTPDTLTATERDELVASWVSKLQANGGGVAYTPQSIEARPHGTASADLLIQGRNAAAVDAARIVGVPAAMIDASNVNSSLTYETLEGRGGEYIDRSLPLYLGPIDARLSLDDVTPAGTRVRADLSALTAVTPTTTQPTTED